MCVLQADSKHADFASKRPEGDHGRAASSSLVAEVRYADSLKPLLLAYIFMLFNHNVVFTSRTIINNLFKFV